jgi:acetylornithine deacetylase/succinyl-diaminopimelate desuccinylase-like protein
MSDTRMLAADRPALAYSLRGSLGMEVVVSGPRGDLHSGNFGGAVHNPLQVLADLLSGLHDRDGRVTIRGFYDRVRRVPEAERERMARTGPTDAEILRDAQVERGFGERGYSLYERTTIRPALTINGLSGGYQGPGGKAVIPARATAKIIIRLVPDQDPQEILAKLRAHLDAEGFADVALTLLASAEPGATPLDDPFAARVIAVAERVVGKPPAIYPIAPGSLPIVAALKRHVGLPGLSAPDNPIYGGSAAHAPNEHVRVEDFAPAIEFTLAILEELAG